MKNFLVLSILFTTQLALSQVVLNADGPGNTYSLINSVLAPGNNAIETPDCSHNAFGNHIDEVFDTDLNTNVFRFYIHITPDNDRCINFDRQRNEIKTYNPSPANLLGTENEIVIYKWKFKLPVGFQSSTNFTHIHQLKSVGGALEDMPMYTLTTRKSNPDLLQLRYAETNSQVTVAQVNLTPFIGQWVEVTETIKYSTVGSYAIEIKKVSDNTTLLSYSNNAIVNWRAGASFVRPKWGIYRSLLTPQDLRDEEVLFANFSIQEVTTLSNNEVEKPASFKISIESITKTLNIIDLPNQTNSIQLFNMNGSKVLEKTSITTENEISLDISGLSNGIYIVNVNGNNSNQSKLTVISFE